MKYFSYRPDVPPPKCDHPDRVRIKDHDTVRLVVAPDSEKPKRNCPLEVYEPTPTGDLYEGQIKHWRWEGRGTFTLPSGAKYVGEFKDGGFHGTGTLHFPTGAKYEGQWDQGVCTNGLYTFADGLAFSDKAWKYCNYPDRRYWSEIQHGLKPAGRSQLTDAEPSRTVPDDLYDAGDGFYDPQCRTVYDYDQPKRIIRVVTDQEHQWISTHCRHGGDTFMGHREELHQDIPPLRFHGQQSKHMEDIPDDLNLSEILAQPPPEPGQWIRQPGERGGTPEQCRLRSTEVVQDVVQAAEKVAQTVLNVIVGAQKKIEEIETDAREVVESVEEGLSSVGSAVSSILDAARRRIANSSSETTSSDWTSNSEDEKSRIGSGAFTSSSNESVGATRSGTATTRGTSGTHTRSTSGTNTRDTSGTSGTDRRGTSGTGTNDGIGTGNTSDAGTRDASGVGSRRAS